MAMLLACGPTELQELRGEYFKQGFEDCVDYPYLCARG